jgi:hypothetical protein
MVMERTLNSCYVVSITTSLTKLLEVNMTLEYDLDGKHYQIENVKTFKKIENKYVYGVETENLNGEEKYLGEIELKILPDGIKDFHLWQDDSFYWDKVKLVDKKESESTENKI